jgi:hypothetical protein
LPLLKFDCALGIKSYSQFGLWVACLKVENWKVSVDLPFVFSAGDFEGNLDEL